MGYSKLDDIMFAIYKAGGNAVDSLGNIIHKFDPSSIINNMGRGSFFSNLNIPEVPLTSSKMFHTPDYLSNLSKVDLDDLVDVDLPSFKNNNNDFNPKNWDLNDLDDTDLTNLVNDYSASKVSGISEGLDIARKNNLDEVGSDSVSNFDEALKTNPKYYDNTTDMASTFRKKDGVDGNDVELRRSGNNNYDVDDVVNDNINDMRKFVERLNTVVSVSVLAAFVYESYLNRNLVEEGAFDDAVERSDIEEISYDVDLEGIVQKQAEQAAGSFLTNNHDSTLIIGIIIAASIAFLSN